MSTLTLMLALILATMQGHEVAVGTEERAIEKRTYRFHMGKDAKKPAPLVIALHGAGSNGLQTEVLTGLSALADQKGFAAAYPDGTNRLWRYDGFSPDIDFIRDLIDELVKSGEVDRTRVYVTGISNGAYLSNRLACEIGDRIAAIAPVSGTMPKLMAERMKPERPIPVMYFHGTDDKVVGYDGTDMFTKRAASLGAEEWVAWWAKKNGGAEKPEVEKMPDRADDGTTVERWSYKETEKGAPVIFYKITGGGHTWPGSKVDIEKVLGRTTKDIDASELMWGFFEKHRLPQEKK